MIGARADLVAPDLRGSHASAGPDLRPHAGAALALPATVA